MLKLQEYSICHEQISQECINSICRRPSNNSLYKTKHTSSSILSCRVGLDPIATSYLGGSIERTHNVPG